MSTRKRTVSLTTKPRKQPSLTIASYPCLTATTHNAWHGSSGLVEVKSPALSLANFQVNQSFSRVLRCVWFSYQRRVNERRVCAIFSTLMNNSTSPLSPPVLRWNRRWNRLTHKHEDKAGCRMVKCLVGGVFVCFILFWCKAVPSNWF